MQRRVLYSIPFFILILLLIACGGDGNGNGKSEKPYFLALPFSNDNFQGCFANGISDDGTTVVGQCTDENAEMEPVKWVDGKIERLGFMSDAPGAVKNAFSYAVSDNGIIIGNQGYFNLTPVGYYYNNGQWIQIKDVQSGLLVSSPNSISSSGQVIVGSSYYSSKTGSAFYMRVSDSNIIIVPSIFNEGNQCEEPGSSCVNELKSIDASGTKAVGFDTLNTSTGTNKLMPIFYDLISGMTKQLDIPQQFPMGVAQGISRNGDFISGGLFDPNLTPVYLLPSSAVYWDKEHHPHDIGRLGEYVDSTQTIAYAVSNTGVAVGESNGQAFIYESGKGMKSLAHYIEEKGIGNKIKDWKRLANAKAITPDGRYIVGTGRNAGGYPQAYLVFFP